MKFLMFAFALSIGFWVHLDSEGSLEYVRKENPNLPYRVCGHIQPTQIKNSTGFDVYTLKLSGGATDDWSSGDVPIPTLQQAKNIVESYCK